MRLVTSQSWSLMPHQPISIVIAFPYGITYSAYFDMGGIVDHTVS